MIFHIAVCSPDPVLRGRVQRHCMEYYARRADACIVEQLESTAALLQQEEAGSRYELYLIELPAANPCSGLQAAAELRRRGVRAPLAFLAHTTAYAYEAFRVDAMQYLHIPFRPEQLTALLDRATEPEYGPVIPVTTAMGLRALPFADIEYLECTHHVVHYHLASGVDVVYPPENDRLYEDVAASGVLLSEYPPGAEPFGWHFPARNRILSGLCLATLVVEAPEKSGALITAATALEQGRDVFAIPGPLDAEGSVGCNRLIRDGAGLATESWDILREYQSRYPHKLHPDGEKLPPLPKKSEIFYPERSKKPKVASSGLPIINVRRNAEGLTDDQIKVLRILDDKEPMLTDDIALRANVPVRRILSAVTMLEIDGYTRQEGLRKFVRTVEVEDTKE